jgi:pyrimidine deaminase RibD-like protein
MGFGPGNKAFEVMGDHYNTLDPCQHYGKPEGYKLADFCFINAGKRVYSVKDANNRIIYKIQ